MCSGCRARTARKSTDRIAVGGQSSGGNLAMATLLGLRDDSAAGRDANATGDATIDDITY